MEWVCPKLWQIAGHAGSIPNVVQCRSVKIRLQELIPRWINKDHCRSIAINFYLYWATFWINSWNLIFIDRHWSALVIDLACPENFNRDDDDCWGITCIIGQKIRHGQKVKYNSWSNFHGNRLCQAEPQEEFSVEWFTESCCSTTSQLLD